MVYLGIEPEAAGWKAQTDPLSNAAPQYLIRLNACLSARLEVTLS